VHTFSTDTAHAGLLGLLTDYEFIYPSMVGDITSEYGTVAEVGDGHCKRKREHRVMGNMWSGQVDPFPWTRVDRRKSTVGWNQATHSLSRVSLDGEVGDMADRIIGWETGAAIEQALSRICGLAWMR
jgi:hypothetical protein